VSGIVGFGALNMDKIMLVDKIPSADEEGYVLSMELHPGGSAANTLVGLSRLGTKAACIGKIGGDWEGEAILGDLEKNGVETRAIIHGEGRSGSAISMVDTKGHRALLIDPGVNDEITEAEVDIGYVSRFDILHMTSFVCRESTTSLQAQISTALKVEVPLTLDPGHLYAERGISQLEPLIRRSKALLPSEREVKIMTGLDPVKGAKKLMSLGAEVVAVKMGERGCYVTDGHREYKIPAVPTRVVDTTGAGDAFNAGFLYGMAEGMDIEESARIGVWVASFCIRRLGARSGLPTLKDLEKAMENDI